jgi:hypothetical protein
VPTAMVRPRVSCRVLLSCSHCNWHVIARHRARQSRAC